jgi:hypothetical protein
MTNKSEIKYYSIGCDCHPSHVLEYLKLKHYAGPFDYIYIRSIYTPEYFFNLINSSFINFKNDLSINENGKVSSKHYPQTEFTHDSDLITSVKINRKYERRIKRFMNDYKNLKCVFLLNINYDSICNENEVTKLIDDIKNIINEDCFVKKNHILYIYLRYDENFDQNKKLCECFIEQLSKLKQTKNLIFKKYCRHKSQYGIWGNPLEYSVIFSDLFEL